LQGEPITETFAHLFDQPHLSGRAIHALPAAHDVVEQRVQNRESNSGVWVFQPAKPFVEFVGWRWRWLDIQPASKKVSKRLEKNLASNSAALRRWYLFLLRWCDFDNVPKKRAPL
jgi:hypothetical protein